MSWSKTYTFSPSTTILSAEVNQNFDDLVSAVNEAMPSGIIVKWNGSVASIPTGFYLCNGSNGTPDLRGKFVIGAGGAYNPADTGGEATHTLDLTEMPYHRHTRKWRANQNDTSGSGNDINDGGTTTGYTGYAGGSGGVTQPHNNLPPYYALAYIMKS